jgi:uncharacterized protein involved in exopolysaccharide biosynthesis
MARPKDVPVDSEETSGPSRPGRPIEPLRVLSVIARGRWWLLGAAVLGLIVGVGYAKLGIRHTFETNTSIRYEGVEPLDPSVPPDLRRELPPLVDALRREVVLDEVKRRMDLPAVPIAVINARFSQQLDGEAGILAITAVGDSPEDAALFANTLVDVFLEHQIERRRAAITEAMGTLTERIAAAQEEQSRAQSAYDAFRRAHGVSSELSDDQTAAMAATSDLRARAGLAEAAVSGLEARVARLREQASSGGGPEPGGADDGQGASARAALAEARRQLESVRGRLSEDHPRYQALQQQVAELEAQVRATGGASAGSGAPRGGGQSLREAEAQLESSRRELTRLQQLAQEAQARVVSFSAIEGDAAELLADVTVKTQLLTDLRNRRARLENMLSEIDSGFRVVARAVEPESAIPSRRKYYVAVGAPLALVLLVLLGLLVRELRGLKLTSAAEVAFWANAPVVGTSPWPRDRRALTDLIADLDDFVPDARGTMLVMGATDREIPLAVELARAMSADWSPDATTVDLGPMGRGRADADGRRSLPASGGDFENAPTGVRSELLAPPTLVQSGAPYGLFAGAPDPLQRLITTPWESSLSSPGLRRQARLADRVLVIVPSGAITVPELRDLRLRLGREEGVGFVVAGTTPELAKLPDRCGPVEEFWAATRQGGAEG